MHIIRLALTPALCFSFALLGPYGVMQRSFAAEAEVQRASELTQSQKNTIDTLMAKALANPRQDAPRSLSMIQKIGPGALIYSSRETSKLLFIPVEVNPDAGFDLLLMQVLKNLRSSQRLDDSSLTKLKEIAASDNEYHAGFAKEIILIQESLSQ